MIIMQWLYTIAIWSMMVMRLVIQMHIYLCKHSVYSCKLLHNKYNKNPKAGPCPLDCGNALQDTDSMINVIRVVSKRKRKKGGK